MVAAPLVLSLVAAAFFLLIGLEELPFAWNVQRVSRAVRRRARRLRQEPMLVLQTLRVSTRRSVWVLAGFAVASAALLWVVRARSETAAPLTAAILAFGATCVAGLLFLAFAFHVWAPRLMAKVAEQFAAPTAGSNAGLPFKPGTP